MAVKQFIEPKLESGRVVTMGSLNVKEAFDAAWWPAVLKGLREAKCPQNLYQHMQDCFRGRRAVTSINSCKMEKNITEVCPQGSCCGPVSETQLHNLRYSSICR